ncbi:hypothetical protein ACQP0C_30440 [Nocardia sp. CA-129566]|uniref:hypothetical protein n=1 Tax=Nocardia sp. CA-129566 TaxID=3239976 RepID=UPI003D98C8C9
MDGELLDGTIARAVAELAFASVRGMVVYVDRVVRGPGEIVCGSRTVHCDRPCVIVFRDEQPGANWMHACSYGLVDPERLIVRQRWADDRPPVFGLLPETWVVASDPDKLADLVRVGE